MSGNVVRFPTRRIADARHVFLPYGQTPDIEALEQAWRSVCHAKKALLRQEQSVLVRLRAAIDEYRQRPQSKAEAREHLRAILAKWDAEADADPDGAA